ncbi:MAG: DEAD/DEAH box helicase family protein, partial [Clostridia bacterium]|nr:DEAD/DEAH box helicase family protein [Clostridia bacterium]
MDKHALSYYLLDNIEKDEFLQRKYKELLIAYSKSLFSEYSENYTDEYRKLLRYAEMLSLAEKEKHQNIAQQIVILLDSLFPDEKEIGFFKQHIYTNVSNFASANMPNQGDRQFNSVDILRNVEVEAHKIINNIPDTDKQYFDTQLKALNGIENNQFYSFSAPTSMGKTFVITNFIRNKIKTGCKDNFVIIVPTRAL